MLFFAKLRSQSRVEDKDKKKVAFKAQKEKAARNRFRGLKQKNKHKHVSEQGKKLEAERQYTAAPELAAWMLLLLPAPSSRGPLEGP